MKPNYVVAMFLMFILGFIIKTITVTEEPTNAALVFLSILIFVIWALLIMSEWLE